MAKAGEGRSGDVRSRLLLIGTSGTENPSKAVMPFVVAVGASRSKKGIEASIGLLGDAVVLMKDAVVESLVPLGYPPLKDLWPQVLERGVKVYV
jgi:predicted peroxiredoxin